MTERLALQIIKDNISSFKEDGENNEGCFRFKYYYTVVSFIVMGDTAYISVCLHDGEKFNYKVNIKNIEVLCSKYQ